MSLHYGNYDSKNERKQHNCHNDTAILTEIIVFNPYNSVFSGVVPGHHSRVFIIVF